MKRVLCTLPLPAPAPATLEPLAELRVLGRIPDADELQAELAAGVDVLCSQLRDRVDAEVLAAGAPRLAAVCNYAVGYDNIDLEAATRQGVWVTNTPDVLTEATADCALGLMIAAARRLCEGDAEMRAGRFRGWEPEYLLGTDVTGASLGILGFGRIGQAVARRALAFAMDVAYHDPGDPQVAPDLERRIRSVSFDELVECSDFLSLHAPLTPATHHVIDERVLRRMRRNAVLVNTARGPLVDEIALARALSEGWIQAAGLDVYEHEPDVGPALRECPNTVLAPHLGSATTATRAQMAKLCAANAVAALEGRRPPTALNPGARAAA